MVIERGGSPRPIDKFITEDEKGLNLVKIEDAPEKGNYITSTKEIIKPEGLSKTREVYPGDLILSNSMSFGRPYIMGTDMMLSQYKAMAAGSTVKNLNKELVGSTDVRYPNLAEQKKIGEYFSYLDNLIILHQRKCDSLKELKKFMLHNMFV